MTCPSPGCTSPISGNGAGCHDHFVERIFPCLRTAYFSNRNRRDFTARWIRAQVLHALRGEPFAADPKA